MPEILNDLLNFLSSPTFGLVQIIAIAYIGLLWLSIIIWVTRDSINRSSSLLFQTFSILINILVPILGVLLYLIIRPSQTNMERYYEEAEHRLLLENAEERVSCEKCMTMVDKNYTYCPQCGTKVKKACTSCKKKFPSSYSICPYCGKEQRGKKTAKKKAGTKK